MKGFLPGSGLLEWCRTQVWTFYASIFQHKGLISDCFSTQLRNPFSLLAFFPFCFIFQCLAWIHLKSSQSVVFLIRVLQRSEINRFTMLQHYDLATNNTSVRALFLTTCLISCKKNTNRFQNMQKGWCYKNTFKILHLILLEISFSYF